MALEKSLRDRTATPTTSRHRHASDAPRARLPGRPAADDRPAGSRAISFRSASLALFGVGSRSRSRAGHYLRALERFTGMNSSPSRGLHRRVEGMLDGFQNRADAVRGCSAIPEPSPCW